MATLDPSPTIEKKNVYAQGGLRVFKSSEKKTPWLPMDINFQGDLGAIRYDPTALRSNSTPPLVHACCMCVHS